LALVRAWLCDRPHADGACGQCGSCHAIEVRTQADLCVLMPETAMLALNWPLGEKAQEAIDSKARKPSREIRVDAMRDAVEFTQRTNARGRGKAVLVYPAERMNNVTANTLLKTLEEPPGDVRFVLACEAAHQVLPTIRSRCLGHAMVWPTPDTALHWLAEQGVAPDAARVWLRASGGRPMDALHLAVSGAQADQWAQLPRQIAQGDGRGLADLPMPGVVAVLQKLCHDLMATGQGAQPRFFAVADLPANPGVAALGQWASALAQTARTADHPFNAGLMLEALLSQASQTWRSGAKIQSSPRLTLPLHA
jgi:DNA polymerase-3 subunit delta'